MKKYLFASIALGALALASCSSEEFDVKPAGAEGNVTFTASLPASVASRDYSDGSTAKNLQYAIYAQGTQTPLLTGTATFENLKATVSTTLATGKTYDILFWAQAADAPYAFDNTTQKVTVNYEGITANNESLDAFFWAEKDLTVSGPVNKTITLTRPFAQVNVGTNDFVPAQQAGLDVKQSSLTFSAYVANTLDLYSGDVTGDDEVTFGMADIPAGETFPVDDYKYLAMAYVLVPADKQTLDVTLATDGTPNTPVFASVPVQRNYRTNIYGALLTDPAVFNVEINPDYIKPDFGQEILPEGAIQLGSQKFTTLAEAVKAATDENNVILLGDGTYSTADLRGLTAKGLTLKCAGASVVLQMSSAITLADKDMVFEGITLETPNANYTGFQHVNTVKYSGCTIKNKLFLYGNEETFDNCKFVNNGDYHVWTYGAKNVTFNNCQFGDYGKSLLVYNEAKDLNQTVNINNCSFKGTSVFGKAAVEIDASLLSTGLYTININNTTVEGFDKGSVSGSNLWNPKKGNKYIVTIDGVKYDPASIEYTADGINIHDADGLKAMSSAIKTGTDFVGKTINLTSDLDLAGVEMTPLGAFVNTGGSAAALNAPFRGTFDGQNHTISNFKTTVTDYKSAAGFFGYVGEGAVIKNLTLTNPTVTGTAYTGALIGKADKGKTYVTISNVTVDGANVLSVPAKGANGEFDGGNNVGGLVGIVQYGVDITGCTVKNSTITGYAKVGGFIGLCCNLNQSGGTNHTVYENNKVEKCQVIQSLTNPYESSVPTTIGEFYGQLRGPALPASNTTSDVTVTPAE